VTTKRARTRGQSALQTGNTCANNSRRNCRRDASPCQAQQKRSLAEEATKWNRDEKDHSQFEQHSAHES
jgi:hypothetical protein